MRQPRRVIARRISELKEMNGNITNRQVSDVTARPQSKFHNHEIRLVCSLIHKKRGDYLV